MGKSKKNKTLRHPKGPEGPGGYIHVRSRHKTLPQGTQEKPQIQTKEETIKVNFAHNIPGRTLPPPFSPPQISDNARVPNSTAEIREKIDTVIKAPDQGTTTNEQASTPACDNLDSLERDKENNETTRVNVNLSHPETTIFGNKLSSPPLEKSVKAFAESLPSVTPPSTSPPERRDQNIGNTFTSSTEHSEPSVPSSPSSSSPTPIVSKQPQAPFGIAQNKLIAPISLPTSAPSPPIFSPSSSSPPSSSAPPSSPSFSTHPWFSSELPTDPQGFLRIQRIYFRCLNRATRIATEEEKATIESVLMSIENVKNLTDLSSAISRLSLSTFSEPVKKVIRETSEYIAGRASIDAHRRSFQRLDELLPPAISTSDSFHILPSSLLSTQLLVDGKIFDFTFDPNSFDIGEVSLSYHGNTLPILHKFTGRSLLDPGTLQKLAKTLQEVAAAPGYFIGKEICIPDIQAIKESVEKIFQKVTDTFNKKKKKHRLTITHQVFGDHIKICVQLGTITETITVIASENGPVIHNHETLHGLFTTKILEGIVDILEKERKAQSSIRNIIPFLSTPSAEARRRTRQAAFVALSLTVVGGISAFYKANRSTTFHYTTSSSDSSSPPSPSPFPSPSPSSPSPPSPSPSSPSIERLGEASVGDDQNANTERALVHIFSALSDPYTNHRAHITNHQLLKARLRHALHGTNPIDVAHMEQVFIELHYDTHALIIHLQNQGKGDLASRLTHLRTRPSHDSVLLEKRVTSERRELRVSIKRDATELYSTDWFPED